MNLDRLYEEIYTEYYLKPFFGRLLNEEHLSEMANHTKDMFIGAFENALKLITSNYNYLEPDKTVREVVSYIIRDNTVTYPFAIKYDDNSSQKGKIIVFEKYKPTVEAAAQQRIEAARELYEKSKKDYNKNRAKNDLYYAKTMLSKICVADEEEIRDWITDAMNNIKVQEYKNIVIDVFMVMYEALPTILTVEQVEAKLNRLPVLPHSGGTVTSFG